LSQRYHKAALWVTFFLKQFGPYFYKNMPCNLSFLCYNSYTMLNNMDIPQQTSLLLRLQEIDSRIYMLKTELEERPREIDCLKDSIDSKKNGMKKAEDNLKALQLKHKEKEVALGSKEAEIKKLEGQLYQIKTNKEYAAMINEIESRKADNSILEEEIINLMDSIDQAKSRFNQEKEKFSRESEVIEKQIKEIEKTLDDIKAQVVELDEKRQGLSPSIDTKLLSEYERILNGRNGQALAEVVAGSCGGCYMQLPPQVINEIKMKQKIIRCENCQRMLYISDGKNNS
jgi:uncharacterized protein